MATDEQGLRAMELRAMELLFSFYKRNSKHYSQTERERFCEWVYTTIPSYVCLAQHPSLRSALKAKLEKFLARDPHPKWVDSTYKKFYQTGQPRRSTRARRPVKP